MINFVARRLGWKLTLMAAGVLVSESVLAAELSVTPLLRYTADYQTNRRMAFDNSNPPPDGTQGNQFSLGADLSAQTDRTKISMQPRFDLWRFLGAGSQEDLDTENVYLNLDASHYLIERLVVTMLGKYAYDSVLTTEGPGGTSGPAGGGLVDAIQNRRIERNLSPGLRFLLTEQDSVDLGVSYDDVSYDNTGNNASGLQSYRDYLTRSANGRWTHRLNETDSFFVNAFSSQFRVAQVTLPQFRFPEGANDSDNYGLNFGYTGQFREHWTASIGAGVQYTESRFAVDVPIPQPDPLKAFPNTPSYEAFCQNNGSRYLPFTDKVVGKAAQCFRSVPKSDEDFGALFNFELARTFEAGRASVVYSRTIGPTGFGSQQTVDVIELHGEQGLSDRARVFMDFAYSSSEYASQTTGGFSNRDYFSIGGHVDYKLYQYVSLIGGYYYRSQDYGQSRVGGSALDADTHVVMLSIMYNGDKRTFYR
jgi:hypothetical protein